MTASWRELYALDRVWILRGSPLTWPQRAAQATTVAVWPVAWQYQVYFHCRTRVGDQ